MRRVAALFIALAMMFAVGCQPPDAGGGGGDTGTDANTTSIEIQSPSIDGEGVQLVSLKLPGMT